MNRYGAMMQRHWQRWLPEPYAAIRDPDRGGCNYKPRSTGHVSNYRRVAGFLRRNPAGTMTRYRSSTISPSSALLSRVRDIAAGACGKSPRLAGLYGLTGPTGLRRSAPGACHLPGSGVNAVEQVGRGDHQDDRGEALLVVVVSRLVPDLVWYRVRPVAEASGGLGQGQGGALSVGEVGRLPPRRHREQPLIGLASLLRLLGAHVNAGAAAIDLAGAQVDKLQCRLRHAAPGRGLHQALD